MTRTSGPSSRWMNPKTLASSNHFTVPRAKKDALLGGIILFPVRKRQDPTAGKRGVKTVDVLRQNRLGACSRLLSLAPAVRAQISKRTRANLEILDEALTSAPTVTRLPVEAGWYAMVRIPAVEDSESWTLRLLQEASVYVHPGRFFGMAEASLVVSLLCRPEVFSTGIARVLRLVRDRVDSLDA